MPRRFLLCIQQLATLSLKPVTPSASASPSPRGHRLQSHAEPEARCIAIRDRCALHALCAALFSLVGALYEEPEDLLRAPFEPVREYIAGVVRARQQRAPFLLPASAFHEYNWVLAHRSDSSSSACVRAFAPESHVRRAREPLCVTDDLLKDVAAIAASRPQPQPAAVAPLDASVVATPALLPAEVLFESAVLSRLLEQLGFKAEELTQLSTPFCVFESAQLGGVGLSMRQSVTSASIASMIGPQDDLDARLFCLFNVLPPDSVRPNETRTTQLDRIDNSQRQFYPETDDKTGVADGETVSLASNWQMDDGNIGSRIRFTPASAPPVDDPHFEILLQTLAPDARNDLLSLSPNERAARLVQLLGGLQYDHFVSLSRLQCDATRAANELMQLSDTSNAANGAGAPTSNDLELRVEMTAFSAGINGNGVMQKSALSNNSSSSARDSREYSPLIAADF